MSKIRLIQLSAENKIEKINKLSDELIGFVKEYEEIINNGRYK